jgi:hypothetical protein
MCCLLELTVVQEEDVCVHSESTKGFSKSFLQTAYNMLVGRHDIKSIFHCFIYIHICVCVGVYTYKYTHTHTHKFRLIIFTEN